MLPITSTSKCLMTECSNLMNTHDQNSWNGSQKQTENSAENNGNVIISLSYCKLVVIIFSMNE